MTVFVVVFMDMVAIFNDSKDEYHAAYHAESAREDIDESVIAPFIVNGIDKMQCNKQSVDNSQHKHQYICGFS